MVAPHGAHHAGPGLLDAQLAAFTQFSLGTVLTQDHRLHTEERTVRTPRLQRHRTGKRSDHKTAGLGLPPGIHDRTPVATDLLVIPDPRFRVDRFAHGSENLEAGQIILRRPLVSLPDQRPDSGGRGIELGDLELVDHLPVPTGVRVQRGALEHHAGGPVGEWAVHDVTVTRNPADVRGAEVYVLFLQVEGQLVSEGDPDQVTAGAVDHALGLAGGAGGVEDEQGILRVHLLGLTVRRRVLHHVVIPDVPTLLHGNVHVGPPDHHDLLDGRSRLQGIVRDLLQGHVLAGALRHVRRDQDPAVGIVDTALQSVGGEPSEHDGMDRTDPSTRHHHHRQLRDHA